MFTSKCIIEFLKQLEFEVKDNVVKDNLKEFEDKTFEEEPVVKDNFEKVKPVEEIKETIEEEPTEEIKEEPREKIKEKSNKVKKEKVKKEKVKKEKEIKVIKDKDAPVIHTVKPGIYIPKQTDSLFWCFYILKYGYSNYEMEIRNQYFTVEKKEKYKYLNMLRDNKALLKLHNIKPFTLIEDDLSYQKYISIKTFISLCIIENINIILVDNYKIYEFIMDEFIMDEFIMDKCNNSSNNINVVHRNNITKEHYIEYDLSQEEINKYRNTYYKVNNFENTLKNISAYKVDDLLDLCNKLHITLDNNKKLTKKYIYEILIQNY